MSPVFMEIRNAKPLHIEKDYIFLAKQELFSV
jgi:hypothetical protein